VPRTDFTLCQQFTLIGSGMIWNVYFGLLALVFGVFLPMPSRWPRPRATRWLRKPAEWFVFIFRGSPLFIQFFLAYEALVLLPKGSPSLGSHQHRLDHPRLGGRADRPVPQHRRLFRRDLPRRAEIDPEGRP
jgi:ABC-type amino acid transport system permease subunit